MRWFCQYNQNERATIGVPPAAKNIRSTAHSCAPCVAIHASTRNTPIGPALIDRVRSAVSDSDGQYKIEALRPGVYTVTFTLQAVWGPQDSADDRLYIDLWDDYLDRV